MWLRQIAQLSTTMSHAQRATAFHYMSLKQMSASFLVLKRADFAHMYVASDPHLLDLEALLLLAITTLLLVDDGCVGHLDVGHVRD